MHASYGRVACSTLVLLLSLSLAAAATTTTLTPEMVVDLKQVADVALDPTGTHVAYRLNVPRAEDDEPGNGYAELWVARIDGREAPRRFAGHDEVISAPGWSSDGKSLTFLAKRKRSSEFTQIYELPLNGGEARPLTEHDSSIGQYRWAPRGGLIAFVARDAETDEEKEDKEAGRDWKVVDEQQKFRRLWLLDIESGETRKLVDADLDVSAFTWNTDGTALFIQAAETTRIDDQMMFSRIYRVGVRDPQPRLVTETAGKLGPMEVAPDGRLLAFLGATSLNDPLAQSLFVVPVSGGEARNLTPDYEGSASGLGWHDAQTVLLLSVEGTGHALHHVSVKKGAKQRLPWSDLVIRDLDLAAQAGLIAFSASSASHPNELFVVDAAGGQARQLSRHNPQLEGLRLAKQEVIEWKSSDGMRIEGVLTYPLDFKRGTRYPLVLQVHGGPEGVSMNGWRTRAGYPVQILAAAGYMVLEPNYRGSQGRGVAFTKADHDDLGGLEFTDVLAGVDALIERGWVDGDRVGSGGWSYGGYMSAWAATRHSSRFRAAIMAAGLSNWIAFAGTTDIPHEMSLVHWNSYWMDEPELHWERSPLAHVKNSKTPTLIVHGEEDTRVHPEQGLELYTALRLQEVDTRFVLYPREPHGLNERAHQLDFIRRTVDWFDEHMSVIEVEQQQEIPSGS